MTSGIVTSALMGGVAAAVNNLVAARGSYDTY